MIRSPEQLRRIQSAEMVEATMLNRAFVNLLPIIAALTFTGVAAAQEHVSFATSDGGTVYADLYGKGDRGVALAHGGRLNKESWEKERSAELSCRSAACSEDLKLRSGACFVALRLVAD